jgi:hypothetical protein
MKCVLRAFSFIPGNSFQEVQYSDLWVSCKIYENWAIGRLGKIA